MQRFSVRTRKKPEVVDITDAVQDLLEQEGNSTGACSIFVLHTTAALTTADLDPGTDLDILDAFEAMVPKLRYRHPHNPAHVGDHILSALIGTSVSAPSRMADSCSEPGSASSCWSSTVPARRELVLTVSAEP